jgi:anthranilate synthase
VTAGRYHSLCADRSTLPADLVVTAETEEDNLQTVMAFEHSHEPVAAVQFHPESMMTMAGDAGIRMVENAVKYLAGKKYPKKVVDEQSKHFKI